MSFQLAFTLLQDVSFVNEVPGVTQDVSINYFTMLMKGGWILAPIFLLLFISVYIIIERWLVLRHATNDDKMWLPRVKELINEKRDEKALVFCSQINNSSSRVISTGLEEIKNGAREVEEAMQVESRQEVGRLEKGMNYLGISATIAPMLGFLGTIFGVITIFYNISVTNDLSIGTISDGLYQKMICSGVGLFVGIIAYAGYYILNTKIDRVVAQVEKDSNEILKTIRLQNKA
ncbi:MAG TPA: MotA/TolQ/ExbB proton channel family protein [Porphyromonadaceae bacterium]|jgi:biopolymer transport protein ExbB|uniref:MotA/TolQ/ExbB proton channel family protein n=1 Tax=Limibacterium fermenti TaxID=3229863 RepID=UPI000E865C90|nr:MotA/TolQ/ExbB proton channel family protein [Porphyromonadaceae bacterium]HBK31874.1 MotA/TolQ/ExbB proton channel family protein [Porphyromonadaceae bacterium]HBL32192.1 MotA/TolQ/ExbB proton channel family protein [Porphyromonadaceae bacterium]HBX19717.1 MotA/TolQ/ExbB proton channel family protein [Porphyromonadaceae bacterium]HBX46810.1 MotA/TolQ/ExbB proton channel family protein [Porphyromonadaceae bacterium]